MRREVFFVPDEDHFVQNRQQITAAETLGTRAHAEACLHEWIARYSRGDELIVLRRDFSATVLPAFHAVLDSEPQTWNLEEDAGYQVVITVISLALLLDVSDDALSSLVQAFGGGPCDLLIDCLVASRLPDHPIADAPLFPTMYRDLLAAIHEQHPIQRRNACLRFLRKYYANLEGLPWHDAHMRDYSGFFGYWAFEFTACVKAFGLDDRPFADSIYYARDLVHGTMYRTWLPTGYGDAQRNAVAKLEKAWQKDADAQSRAIETEVEKAQRSFRTFVEQILKQSQTQPDKALKAMKDTRESVDLLASLTGLDSAELNRNPDMARALVIGMLSTVADTAADLPQGPGSEMDDVRKAMGEAAEQMAEKEGLDLAEFERELPSELRDRLAELHNADGQEAYRQKMGAFSEGLRGLMDQGELDGDELVRSLEALATQYGVQEVETPLEERVKRELDEKHKDLRKGKSMVDFTFEDLFNGKGSAPKE